MGGMGSGKRSHRRRTDRMLALDVRKLQRSGWLVAGNRFNWDWQTEGVTIATVSITVEPARVWLAYRQRDEDGQPHDLNYPVALEYTACHLGGERVWWRCPRAGCSRRVAVLYRGWSFACRHCHDAVYPSQRSSTPTLSFNQLNRLRERMAWGPGGMMGEIGGKPKGMHWRTYYRLMNEYTALVLQSHEGMSAELTQLERNLGTLQRRVLGRRR